MFETGASIGISDADIASLFIGGVDPLSFASAGLFNLDTFFRFSDGLPKKRSFWLINEEATADLCLTDPGFASGLSPLERAEMELLAAAPLDFVSCTARRGQS